MVDGNDVADLPACLDVAVGLDDLVQRIGPVDQRRERSGLDQAPQTETSGRPMSRTFWMFPCSSAWSVTIPSHAGSTR